MQPRVMITNGAPHDPQTLAGVTAWKLLDLVRIPEEPIGADVAPADRVTIEAGREAARQDKARAEPILIALFAGHHKTVQDGERTAIRGKGAAQLVQAVEITADVDAVVGEVVTALAPMSFGTHFSSPEARARIKEIITEDMARVVKDERSWFADPVTPGSAADAHRKKHYPGLKVDDKNPDMKAFRAARGQLSPTP